jgi:hypothetical protein
MLEKERPLQTFIGGASPQMSVALPRERFSLTVRCAPLSSCLAQRRLRQSLRSDSMCIAS